MTQLWGALLVLVLCPLLGGLPLVEGIARLLAGRRLSQLGTGNISVSAAFYHGGTVVGVLAVLAEALKGVLAVLLARAFFPTDPAWELIALIALVLGRYWGGKGAGATNVTWGVVVHDWVAAALIALIGGISLTVLRDRRSAQWGVSILMPLVLGLRHTDEPGRFMAAVVLSVLLGWLFRRMPDDLDLSGRGSQSSARVFRFFRGDRAVRSLDEPLAAERAGGKAATLSQLKRWGYPVPAGWVLPPGDDPLPLVQSLAPSEEAPLIARSSAVGEDSETASAAGQYQSVSHIASREALQDAIRRCQASYEAAGATRYRRDRGQADAAMAVLVQRQVRGRFSGVAFSRDPVEPGEAVLVEGLPGEAAPIVSGQATPQQYRVSWPAQGEPQIEGSGDLPADLVAEVARLARELERRYRGVPQDLEWTHDGEQLWLLQARPIATLQPIWTRKIAAEVIPGLIPPLTWSINQPLTCGVWAKLFRLVLGKRAQGLDFDRTAALHYGRAYFNATLLGQIFGRMGLPEQSLGFLTQGKRMGRPPLGTTLRNLPGLLRLLGRELRLARDFRVSDRKQLQPTLAQLAREPPTELAPVTVLERTDTILTALEEATYYSILAPLSLSLRQALLRVTDSELDSSRLPEVASLRSLAEIAAEARVLVSNRVLPREDSEALFEILGETPAGRRVRARFQDWLARYGYLSEAATDISVPRWQDNPEPVRALFVRWARGQQDAGRVGDQGRRRQSRRARWVQQRLDLKARTAERYAQLLAQLRWHVLALEQAGLQAGWLSQPGDAFLLQVGELRHAIREPQTTFEPPLQQRAQQRRAQLERYRQLPRVPAIVYGNDPPPEALTGELPAPTGQLQGLGVSPGWAQGRVAIRHQLPAEADIDGDTILVVPYTDAGWVPLLARAGGLVAEVGGRLSHGAIVARECGIPAVVALENATQLLREGERVRIDGRSGTLERDA
ncbi:MAG: pyruvate phosphate dikinase PEP/pyruvate-binding protein [Cyanobacteria bacterium QS_8_64_29]|nr:MAG: pyruvate phosphate dikinase PEP/pyruvate-binding protein [Cyanobacteria bacterium QS_8_64_29]